MKRILVFGMTENPGGVESFLLNYYRRIDKDKLQFDFLCNSHELVAYESELLELGGRTFHITARSQDQKLFKKELKEVFDKYSGEWSAIWVNVCSLANIDYLKIAKKYGIARRIIHSHNSQNMDSRLRGILHKINKKIIGKYATDFWACGMDAAKWFYDEKLLKKAVIINNAIDVDKMAFDIAQRNAIRNQIGADKDTFVIGNVGRLHFQKNQSFALKVFKDFLDYQPDSKLVLVGAGEDEEMLKGKCRELDIEDKVVFAGVQRNVPSWLSSFDLFLFPSLFEGLSVSALEAQANGVPMLASNGVIPEDVKMNDNFFFYSLDESSDSWAEKINWMKANVRRASKEQIKDSFSKKGFDISSEVIRLQKNLLKD